jgi:hypothetical protein
MNRNLPRSRQLNDFGKLPISAKHKHSLQRASVRAECFPNGMQPVEQVGRTTASNGWCRLACPR